MPCKQQSNILTLLGRAGGVHARAADIDGMLLAVLALAPSLNFVSPLATRLATNSPPDHRRGCRASTTPPPRLVLLLHASSESPLGCQ
jgi:hypothetical protein